MDVTIQKYSNLRVGQRLRHDKIVVFVLLPRFAGMAGYSRSESRQKKRDKMKGRID